MNQSKIQPYPKDGQVFQLTIDSEIQEEMIRSFSDPNKFSFQGVKLVEPITEKFMLTELDEQTNFYILRTKPIAKQFPLGHFLFSFQKTFSQHDRKGFVAVGDLSWISVYGFPYYLYIPDDGGKIKLQSAGIPIKRGRWLLQV